MRRTIENQRYVPETSLINELNIADINITGVYSVDWNGDQLLLRDSRDYQPEENVFFIFSTASGIQRLRTYHVWAMDGTFAVVSFIFMNFLKN